MQRGDTLEVVTLPFSTYRNRKIPPELLPIYEQPWFLKSIKLVMGGFGHYSTDLSGSSSNVETLNLPRANTCKLW